MTEEGKTYKIIRMHYNQKIPNKVVDRGLTLEEAQAHCKDKETSSRTAKKPLAVAYTKSFGSWFDGYEEDKK
ncbi:hypothetical protein UFOVP1336_14 [uncultured Caudovirales phage]|uniref:Uncharacterized protein n=1 Tax=uncultured Caudovirales phage TaxID=2100421 RepID=A0A6J5RPU9_9CAUD|nr:hypothetical protein UFOVP1336_14 [uncultured Caudovirales phage]